MRRDRVTWHSDRVTGIDIVVPGAGLRFEADRMGQLRQIGFRSIADGAARLESGGAGIDSGGFPPEAFPFAYPAWGQDTSAVPALRVTGSDGRQGCYLTVEGYHRSAAEQRIRLADAVARLTVDLCFRTSDTEAVIEQWAEISHQQDGPVTLHEAAAAAPVLHAPRPWLTRYDGDWAAEWTASTLPLPIGSTSIASFGAIRPHLQASPFFLLSPDGQAAETSGQVLAGSLAWGGGIRISFERVIRQPALLRVLCGHNPVSGYLLEPGQVFRTPRMVWAWSDAGLRPLTHRLHRWVRSHAIRDGSQIRPTVFNTWEAAYFSFDQASLDAMMSAAADLGAELFLLDDGWFGTEFPRDDDSAGLGDWQPDRRKLPDGIGGLTRAARQHGLRFGLWVEPEMVNQASRLHADHPDWVVSEPGRDRREDRNQLVLDLCRPAVRSFVTRTFDGLLTDNPGLHYLKWDANRDISEPGSAALVAPRQGNLWIDTVRARWQVMADLAARWPDRQLMLCASGGGRTDLGTLAWFHEVWLSDNTDAVTRLRMQWAASHFLPPQVIGAHATRWGGQDLAFACAVAMSARFGFDLDPATLSAAERAACQRAAALYRHIRDLVQLGDLFRLIAPDDDGERAALGYTDETARRGVVLGYQIADASGPNAGSCPVPWVSSRRSYRVRRLSLTSDAELASARSGAELLATGLQWPLRRALTAAIWLVEDAEPGT
jgi:alpha-galactosidase